MRRLSILAASLVFSGLACVSDPGPIVGTPPLPHYVVHPRPMDPPPMAGRTTHVPLPRYASRGYPRNWYPAGRAISRRWTRVVIHHSATTVGGAKRFDKDHRENRGWEELGYHFVIGNGTDTPDGFVEVGSRWNKQKHGAHCKTADNYFNDHGIGVCLVGDFTKTRPTPRQLASLEQLVRFLTERCGISPSQVTSHGAVTGKTECPGQNFQLAALRRAIAYPATTTSLP